MSERLTIAFADASAGIRGVAIGGVGTLLAHGERPTVAPPPDLAADGEAWTLRAADAYELALRPSGEPAALADGTKIWLCSAGGTVGTQALEGVAMFSRGPEPAAPALERWLSIPFDAELAFALAAQGARGVHGHGGEELEAVAFRGRPLEHAAIEKPRLSSTYDGEGRLIRAGIELWETAEAEFALRIGGEAVAHGELVHASGPRTAVAFVNWHHEGRHAPGTYTITTPTAATQFEVPRRSQR